MHILKFQHVCVGFILIHNTSGGIIDLTIVFSWICWYYRVSLMFMLWNCECCSKLVPTWSTNRSETTAVCILFGFY